eukprot:TRINITY_DN26117_c0_g2_i1.p1 TRINITY_DN26117_c0_g2~~TRINITY_DN26117_c0_g2_i1.p1  ORF type:complete len:356 (+),score=59.03 TRINITY_DN26117_c0_g2_i1:77-1069(+)
MPNYNSGYYGNNQTAGWGKGGGRGNGGSRPYYNNNGGNGNGNRNPLLAAAQDMDQTFASLKALANISRMGSMLSQLEGEQPAQQPTPLPAVLMPQAPRPQVPAATPGDWTEATRNTRSHTSDLSGVLADILSDNAKPMVRKEDVEKMICDHIGTKTTSPQDEQMTTKLRECAEFKELQQKVLMLETNVKAHGDDIGVIKEGQTAQASILREILAAVKKDGDGGASASEHFPPPITALVSKKMHVAYCGRARIDPNRKTVINFDEYTGAEPRQVEWKKWLTAVSRCNSVEQWRSLCVTLDIDEETIKACKTCVDFALAVSKIDEDEILNSQ